MEHTKTFALKQIKEVTKGATCDETYQKTSR